MKDVDDYDDDDDDYDDDDDDKKPEPLDNKTTRIDHVASASSEWQAVMTKQSPVWNDFLVPVRLAPLLVPVPRTSSTIVGA